MDQNQKIARRSFALAFTVAFLLLSIGFLVMANLSASNTSPGTATQLDLTDPAPVYQPDTSDVLTVLFIGASSENQTPETFLLVKFDPVQGGFPILVLPPETAVDNQGSVESLTEVYRFGGADYTRNTLAKTLNIPIHRYVRMDSAAFAACMDIVGSMEMELNKTMELDQNGATLQLQEGTQLLDGGRTASLIAHRDYPDGELERCMMIGEVASALINQRKDVALSTTVDKIFLYIINRVDSDISYADYENRKQAAAYLAELPGNPAAALKPVGSYSGQDNLFHLSDTFVALVVQTMG